MKMMILIHCALFKIKKFFNISKILQYGRLQKIDYI